MEPLIRQPFRLPFDPTRPGARGLRPARTFVEHVIHSTRPQDMALIRRLATRVLEHCKRRGVEAPSLMQLGLDVTMAHSRRPLDLWALEREDDDGLMRELLAIARHVDRETGELRDGHRPRHLLP